MIFRYLTIGLLSLAVASPSFGARGKTGKKAKSTKTTETGEAHAEPQAKISPAEYASRFTVKVNVTSSSLFLPSNQSSHGTGFIIELSKTRGVVLTNRHVVDVEEDLGSKYAREIILEFDVDGVGAEHSVPDSVSAKVAYMSPVRDAAILIFDPRQLKRAGKRIRRALLPTDIVGTTKLGPDEIYLRMAKKQGRKVITYGNPLDGVNVATSGTLNGRFFNKMEGAFLQTDAAINPGNSGGPLIDVRTGIVLGMNTAKVVEADNTGYALPLNDILKEYHDWQKDPLIVEPHSLFAQITLIDKAGLALNGVQKQIEAIYPKYFDRFGGAILVTDAHPSSNLKTGDIILSLEGQNNNPFGDAIYRFNNELTRQHNELPLRILRRGEVVFERAPVRRLTQSNLRRAADFVMISGIIFEEIGEYASWVLSRGESRVVVTDQIPGLPGHENSTVASYSVVSGVSIKGEVFPIKSLFDLKALIPKFKDLDGIDIISYRPALIRTENGVKAIVEPISGLKVLRPLKSVDQLPVSQIVTPRELSIREMSGEFTFSGINSGSRDWRNYCKTAIESDSD